MSPKKRLKINNKSKQNFDASYKSTVWSPSPHSITDNYGYRYQPQLAHETLRSVHRYRYHSLLTLLVSQKLVEKKKAPLLTVLLVDDETEGLAGTGRGPERAVLAAAVGRALAEVLGLEEPQLLLVQPVLYQEYLRHPGGRSPISSERYEERTIQLSARGSPRHYPLPSRTALFFFSSSIFAKKVTRGYHKSWTMPRVTSVPHRCV